MATFESHARRDCLGKLSSHALRPKFTTERCMYGCTWVNIDLVHFHRFGIE